MVFRERHPLSPEREALLSSGSGDPYYSFRRTYVDKANWKSVALGLVAGLVPLFLWIAIFQNINDPSLPSPVNPTDNKLQQPVPFVPLKSQSPETLAAGPVSVKNDFHPPILKSISESPNWKKVSTKTYRKNTKNPTSPPPSSTDNNEPTEFGTYPQPTFTKAGNKTIAAYHLIVTKGVVNPDGFPQPAILVNGQSPGPEIRVTQNSILVVLVENKLDTPLTIHYHGIHQRKSFLNDGVPHVTQIPIPPGGSFQYKMNLWPQVGTYFYHAHTNMDVVWLFGPLIIEDDPENYANYPAEYQFEEDKVFILNGVYHDDLATLVKRINGPIHDYPSIVSSVTINGRSFIELTNNITGSTLSEPTAYGYDITTVKRDIRYRFRFINAASDSILSCNISQHNFTIIEVDGIYVEPIITDHIVISPGQRYSFIITMNQEDDNYYIACRHLESQGPLNGLAVLNYFNATKPTKEMLKKYKNGTYYEEMDRWILDDIHANLKLNQTDYYHVPMTVDREYVVNVYEAVWGQRHVYLVNNHYYQDPEIPYFMQLKNGVNITDIPQVFELIEGETAQFIFQNTRTGDLCFSHPWHVHGHHFHVVGEGPNKYDPVVDGARIQRDVESGKQFQFRDAVTVYANQTVGENTDAAYCGWAAIRFSAHNNGLWLAHCHVTPHLIMGKKFVIWEHSEEDPMLTKLMSQKYDYKLPGEPGGW